MAFINSTIKGLFVVVKALKWVGYGTATLCLIAGIIAGFSFAPEPEYSFENKEFQWAIAIMIWAAGAVSTVFTLAFAKLLEYIEEISDKLRNVESKLDKSVAS